MVVLSLQFMQSISKDYRGMGLWRLLREYRGRDCLL